MKKQDQPLYQQENQEENTIDLKIVLKEVKVEKSKFLI